MTVERGRGDLVVDAEYIESGLVDLVKQIPELGIASIAIPPLGCGLGGLDWKDVKPRIVDAFKPLPDVRVVLFEPAGFS